MRAEISHELAVEQLAAQLMRESFIEFAAEVLSGDAMGAMAYLKAIEHRFAQVLHHVWADSLVGRSHPDLIAAVALRLRSVIREDCRITPRAVEAA